MRFRIQGSTVCCLSEFNRRLPSGTEAGRGRHPRINRPVLCTVQRVQGLDSRCNLLRYRGISSSFPESTQMYRYRRTFALIALSWLATTDAALACTWDRNTNAAEREFKASYRDQVASRSDTSEDSFMERHWQTLLFLACRPGVLCGAMLLQPFTNAVSPAVASKRGLDHHGAA